MSNRTPDEILDDFDAGSRDRVVLVPRQIDMRAVLWEVIDDIRYSYRLAMEDCTTVTITPEAIDEVQDAVLNYLTNNWGDD